METLAMYTIYDRPKDYPAEFVARRFDIGAGTALPGPVVARGKTLAEVRAQLPPGLYNLGRNPEDEPQIVESWV